MTALILVGCSGEDGTTPREPAFSPEQIQEMIVLPQEEKDEVLVDLLTTGMDTTAAMDSVLVLFLEDPNVEYGEVGAQGIAISYKGGMVGGIFINPEDNPEVDPDTLWVQESAPISPPSSMQKATPKKAIFLNPHYDDRVSFADRIIQGYGIRLSPAGYDSLEIFKNSEVTLKKFTELSGHRIVHIYSHGWAWPSKTNIQEVYLMSGETWSIETHLDYWEEIEDGDVPLVKIHDGISQFFVSPDFISNHNSLNDETLFYGGFCYSALGTWPHVMVDGEGVGGYMGFDWSVLTAWNAAWNRNFIWNMLDEQYVPRLNVNDWMNSTYPKFYTYNDRVVHITYEGDPTYTFYDQAEVPCSETVEAHDDVYVIARVTAYMGNTPIEEMPVRIDYRKIHCDGHLGSINPVFGETRSNGVYVANITGVFHLDNTQDLIVVRATCGGLVQEKVFPFGVFDGMEGSGLFFPKEAGFFFQF